MMLTVLAAWLPAWAAAAPAATTAPAAAVDPAVTVEPAGNPYADHSDEELTALAATWDSLDQHQRRALLTQMKQRMARSGNRQGIISIRTERRYGRIIRQPDGRLIRIETQVVHVRPVAVGELQAAPRQGFGVGFEYRVAHRAGTAATADATDGADAADADADTESMLPSILEALEPSPPAPVVNPLPVYRVSGPAP